MDKFISSVYKEIELNYENCVCYVVDKDIFDSVMKKNPMSIT